MLITRFPVSLGEGRRASKIPDGDEGSRDEYQPHDNPPQVGRAYPTRELQLVFPEGLTQPCRSLGQGGIDRKSLGNTLQFRSA